MDEPNGRVVLCADDYAMNGGVSEAILALVEAGRISATSCMTNAPDWGRHAAALRDLSGRIGIGLHLTLTWGRPLGGMPGLAPDGAFPSLGKVMRMSLARRLDRAEVEAEVERQLDGFVEATGRQPDFVDGHQHVHVLPVIREAMLAVLARKGLASRLWLRDPSDRVGAILARRVCAGKALLVAALARGFRHEAAAAGFTTNVGFSGFSAFNPARPVGADMEHHLAALGPHPLIMCHPGRPGPEDVADEIAASRHAEFEYLASDAFPALLAERGLALTGHPGPRKARTRDRPELSEE